MNYMSYLLFKQNRLSIKNSKDALLVDDKVWIEISKAVTVCGAYTIFCNYLLNKMKIF